MATEDARKLFVAGLPESITEEVLRQIFETTGGKVVEVSLPRDRSSGRPRGFGFVTFSSSEEANSARGSLDGSPYGGRAISVRPFSSEAPKRGETRAETTASTTPAEDRTLYVGNLPYDTTQQELTQLFAENNVGQVVRVHLPVGPDGKLRGFGFITLASAEAANSAIISLRNFEVRGRRLMINIAHPRGPAGSASGAERGRPGRPRDETPAWSGEARSSSERHVPPPAGTGPEFGPRPTDDGRRPRVFGGEPERSAEWSEGESKKKKKKRRGERAAEAAPKRPRDNWQSWDKDLDDDE